MKRLLSLIKENKISVSLMFIIAVVLVVYCLPRESRYGYTYTENAPWSYGLLTAPFNFYIQKSDNQIQAERDNALANAQVYYSTVDTITRDVLQELDTKTQEHNLRSSYRSYIKNKLNSIYKAGVISVENYEILIKQGKTQVLLRGQGLASVPTDISTFYTPKKAYDEIVAGTPSMLDAGKLKELELNHLLKPNIIYDEDRTQKLHESLIVEIALLEGEVVSGQKIIARGEIVDAKTKNILDSYMTIIKQQKDDKAQTIWLIVGQSIFVIFMFSVLLYFLRYYRNDIYHNPQNILFILLMVTILPVFASFLAAAKMYEAFYILPFALPTILVRTFIDSRTAMITHIITVLLCVLMIPTAGIPEFITIQILIGYVSIFSLRKLSERSQLLYSSLMILASYILLFTAWQLATDGDFTSIINSRSTYLYFCINFVFVSFAYLLVYVSERTFGFISEVTMIELANTNSPLLQQLSEEAPGTFQHSMQVSNLVVSAANKIGANAVLVRTGALYHDIGKLANPIFFTENQPEGVNPHTGLSYIESAQIIIGHVEEGVKMAKKHKLPEQIIDFIRTHHGKGKTGYFYTSYKNENPDIEVDDSLFTYPGPNPFSKETAILMMADTVEAASRSLKENTKEAITDLVERLIDAQVAAGLFNDAPITFKDIKEIKEVFIEKLISMRHVRIAYPEINKKPIKN